MLPFYQIIVKPISEVGTELDVLMLPGFRAAFALNGEHGRKIHACRAGSKQGVSWQEITSRSHRRSRVVVSFHGKPQ